MPHLNYFRKMLWNCKPFSWKKAILKMHINTKNFLATKEIEWLLERFKKLSPAAKYKFITFFKTGIIMTMPIIINHNFLGYKFKWLYAKYAYGCNPLHHCTNAIKGRYSKVFSRLNPGFLPGRKIVMNEFPDIVWDAIYICGVGKRPASPIWI